MSVPCDVKCYLQICCSVHDLHVTIHALFHPQSSETVLPDLASLLVSQLLSVDYQRFNVGSL